MTDRQRSATTSGYPSPKMETDLSPRKTMLVVVIVVGCFAVLWPKVFYPMLVGSANHHIKPSSIDKTTGCCDVISETDVNTIKIMSELCRSIIKTTEGEQLTGKEVVQRCRQEVLETCGIDISVVLQEQVRLGQSVKQILDEIRSLNGSLCLKYNYGVAPWRLGVPHRVLVRPASEASNIRQERPMHLRSELVHPAFRERGRAIPQPQPAVPTRPPPRVVEGRPGPVPGMRPTIGGAGHVVPPPKHGTSSMSVIMPIYTIGIVIFFTYTLMKILFKKQPDHVGGSLYAPVDPDPHFRKEVFESEQSKLGPRLTRENISSKLVVNAMSALLDEVDQEIEARRKSSEVATQDLANGTLSNGDAVKPQDDEEQPTVKVLGMEMTASCEGGKKWSRPESPLLASSSPQPPSEPIPPPQEIFLEGALPAQSHLLVSDSATEPEPATGEDPAVVLSGKMTLSVISLDSENEGGEATNGIDGSEIQTKIEDALKEDTAAVQEVKTEEKQEIDIPILSEEVPPVVEEKDGNEIQKTLEDALKEEAVPEKIESKAEEEVLEAVDNNVQEAKSEEKQEIDNDIPILSEKVAPKVEEKDGNEIQTSLEDALKEDITTVPEKIEPKSEEKGQEVVDNDVQEKQEIDKEEVAPKVEERSEKLETKEDIQKSEPPEEIISKQNEAETVLIKSDQESTSIQDSTAKLIEEILKEEDLPLQVEKSSFNIEDETEKLLANLGDETTQPSVIEKDIQDFLEKLKQENDFQAPSITFDSEDIPHTLEVESLEKEVDDLIQEALENIQQKEILPTQDEQTNERIEVVPETSQIQAFLQVANDEPEKSTNLELKREISNEIEKLIQEVKDLPVVQKELGPVRIPEKVQDSTDKLETSLKESSKAASQLELVSGVLDVSDVEVELKTTKEKLPSEIEVEEKIEKVNLENVTVAKGSSIGKEEIEEIKSKTSEPEVESRILEAEKPKPEEKETTKESEKLPSEIEVEEKVEKVNLENVTVAKVGKEEEIEEIKPKTSEPKVESRIIEAEKPKPEEVVPPSKVAEEEEELGSDEEEVEEIEEIVYEEESEEEEEEEIEIEIEEEEESEEEIPDERGATQTESSSLRRVNGERSEDLVEESKYTTVSGATAAENEISDEELIDNEEVEEEEEEIIEVEEEVEDEEYVNEEGNDVNHLSGESEPEL